MASFFSEQLHGKLNQLIITAVSNFFTETPKCSFIPRLKNVVSLNLNGCWKLKRLPVEISSAGNIKEVCLDGTANEELPSSIEYLFHILYLSFEDCKMFKSLLCSLYKLKSLVNLNLDGFSKFQRFPDELGNLKAWERMCVEGTGIREVLSSIVCLNHFVDFQGKQAISTWVYHYHHIILRWLAHS